MPHFNNYTCTFHSHLRAGYNYGVIILINEVYGVIAFVMSIFFINKLDKKKGLFGCAVLLILGRLLFMLSVVKHNSAQSVIIPISSFFTVFTIKYYWDESLQWDCQQHDYCPVIIVNWINN